MSVVTLPRTWLNVRQNLSFLFHSSCATPPSTCCLKYPTRVRAGRFAVSAVLYSGAPVNQSTKFVETSKSENLIPLYQCIYADHLTPVLAYRCLVNENDTETPSFLFESVESEMETSSVGRYSVVGANPAMEIIAKGSSLTVINHLEGWKTDQHSDEPVVIARRIAEKFHPQPLDDLPEVFCGGFVGYFSYDTVRNTERRPTFSRAPVDDRNLPDVYLGLFDDVLVFDNIEKKIYVIHWVQLDRFSSTEEALDNGAIRLQSLLSKVYDIVNPRLPAGTVELDVHKRCSKPELQSTDSETYKKAVYKAKEHIVSGNIRQLALSQRFVRRTSSHPFEVYRALSIANPSPFMAYLQVEGSVLVASSHEILTHIEPKRKTVNGFHADIGSSLGSLHNSALGETNGFHAQKHYREQIMLPHLTDTDVTKVRDVGSTCWDALQTALPTEAVTGTPKIKSMKLIDDLELNRRFLYGGSVGSISFSGNMNIALSPRTIVFPTGNKYGNPSTYENSKSRREWIAHLHVGVTIVADSDPRDVIRECQSEADIVARAIDIAESSFLS
ncbi:hypothetical protein vseg_013086 [Gypsophila vaccaria]